MELSLHWYWLVQVLLTAGVLYSLYRAWKISSINNKRRWNIWTTISFILITIHIFTPIKIQVETRAMQVAGNYHIESSKVLPAKVGDDSFKQKNQINGITKEDLK